jgi:hypothetical protein
LPLETLPLRRKHDIKQPLPYRQQAGAHLVGLIRGNLRKGEQRRPSDMLAAE